MRVFLPCLLAFLSLGAAPPEPTLTLTTAGAAPKSWSRSALLADPKVAEVTLPDTHDGHPMTYRGVPFAALLGEARVEPEATFKFVAIDGFVAMIPAARLQGPGEPWIAIEPPDHPWPAKRPDAPQITGGPFYLVWAHPEAAGITPEEWPYALARIEVGPSVAQLFPGLVPKGAAAERGFRVFAVNCLPCHRLNGLGEADIGPDLNRPMNPTQYFQPAILPKYIADPQSVRRWPTARMPGFGKVLSPAQIADVVAYLRSMAGRKAP